MTAASGHGVSGDFAPIRELKTDPGDVLAFYSPGFDNWEAVEVTFVSEIRMILSSFSGGFSTFSSLEEIVMFLESGGFGLLRNPTGRVVELNFVPSHLTFIQTGRLDPLYHPPHPYKPEWREILASGGMA